MKRIIKCIDKKLLIAVCILFLFGLLMIFSSSNVTAYMADASLGRFFYKQALWLLISVFVSCFLFTFKTSSYKGLSWIAFFILIILIIFTIIRGELVNDATGWLGDGGIGIQPSEFAKIMIIIWLSCYYSKMEDGCNDLKKVFIPIFVFSFFAILIVLQNDYGTALIFLLVSGFLFLISPTSKKIKSLLVISGIVFVSLLVILESNNITNVLSSEKEARFNFLDPCSRYLDEGNQVCNGYIAINEGGLFGKGLGNSTQKYLYLVHSHTDFIFPIIVEELGVFGAFLLFLFYAFVLIRIYYIGKRSRKSSHRLICYGIGFYLFSHIIINLGGVTGMIPLTGVPLPFMSYGGSFALSTCLALTFVERICYETNKINYQKNKGINK